MPDAPLRLALLAAGSRAAGATAATAAAAAAAGPVLHHSCTSCRCLPQDTAGKPITCKAAIAWEANKPLEVRLCGH